MSGQQGNPTSPHRAEVSTSSHSETSNISIQTMESDEHEVVVNTECSPRTLDSSCLN